MNITSTRPMSEQGTIQDARLGLVFVSSKLSAKIKNSNAIARR